MMFMCMPPVTTFTTVIYFLCCLSVVNVHSAGIKLVMQLQEVMVQPCYAILKNATLVQVGATSVRPIFATLTTVAACCLVPCALFIWC
jgi:hypothetical protein